MFKTCHLGQVWLKGLISAFNRYFWFDFEGIYENVVGICKALVEFYGFALRAKKNAYFKKAESNPTDRSFMFALNNSYWFQWGLFPSKYRIAALIYLLSVFKEDCK